MSEQEFNEQDYHELCEYLDSIEAPPEKFWWFRFPVVYFLRFEDRTVYFGSTGRPYARWAQHKSLQEEPFTFNVLCVGSIEYVRALEKKLIRRYAITGRLRNKTTYHWEPPQNKGFKNGSSVRNQHRQSDSSESYDTVLQRVRRGEPIEQALQPKNRRVKQWVEFEGEQWGVKELAAHLGISYQGLQYRIKKGINITYPKTPGRRL